MKKITILILMVVVGLFSCNNHEKKIKREGIVKTDSIKVELVERFFPKIRETIQTDTLIQNLNLKISIIQNPLDSYVVNEFESGTIKYIDKYRDYETHLIIKRDEQVLIDTIYKKQDFSEFNNKDFLEISIFHGYWFNKVNDNTIELFGTISKPETDWSFDFYHYIDLSTLKITLKVVDDKDI